MLDLDKAALLGDRNVKPTTGSRDRRSAARAEFPQNRLDAADSRKMQKGRIYFMLFANTGMPVKSGSRVTLTVGDFKAETSRVN